MFCLLFFFIIFDTVKNICIKLVKKKIVRKKLLSERKLNKKLIGYARGIEGETDYLNNQIYNLNNFGCKLIFSEIISLTNDDRPQWRNAMNSLSIGDMLVIDTLDRAFKSKNECIRIVNQLLMNGIHIKTLSGGFCSIDNDEVLPSLFNILFQLDNLDNDILKEKKKEMLSNRKLIGINLGGRPKISKLKESLVLRLRDEGYSYRTIRSQTGVALSTIRRIIIESEDKV